MRRRRTGVRINLARPGLGGRCRGCPVVSDVTPHLDHLRPADSSAALTAGHCQVVRCCETQVGTDMLFEQIPAYLEFFGFGTATPDELRDLAHIQY